MSKQQLFKIEATFPDALKQTFSNVSKYILTTFKKKYFVVWEQDLKQSKSLRTVTCLFVLQHTGALSLLKINTNSEIKSEGL